MRRILLSRAIEISQQLLGKVYQRLYKLEHLLTILTPDQVKAEVDLQLESMDTSPRPFNASAHPQWQGLEELRKLGKNIQERLKVTEDTSEMLRLVANSHARVSDAGKRIIQKSKQNASPGIILHTNFR